MLRRYLLAVSGGPDSMAMLNMYKNRAKAVCTVNYNKRQDSNKDVEIVRNFCEANNIKFYLKEIDPNIYKETKIDNFQSFARKLRYDFFLEIAKKENIKRLMIAHNLNDSLETAYMQFSRNSKSLFYGIREKSRFENLILYRPLLIYQKDCLMRYCDEKNIMYAIDISNDSDIYERNRVRKIIKSWDQDQLIGFIKKIKKYNKHNRKKYNQNLKRFHLWKDTNFNLSYLKKFDNDTQYYLIYDFLKLHNEKNNSSKKINEIIKYINNNSNNSKKYRLENKRFLIKLDNQLKII